MCITNDSAKRDQGQRMLNRPVCGQTDRTETSAATTVGVARRKRHELVICLVPAAVFV